jgi:hypothetical protein
MSELASLPDEVLKLVMQHVTTKERLTSCCFVSKRLHDAAAAATQQLLLFEKGKYLPEGRWDEGNVWTIAWSMFHQDSGCISLILSDNSQSCGGWPTSDSM